MRRKINMTYKLLHAFIPAALIMALTLISLNGCARKIKGDHTHSFITPTVYIPQPSGGTRHESGEEKMERGVERRDTDININGSNINNENHPNSDRGQRPLLIPPILNNESENEGIEDVVENDLENEAENELVPNDSDDIVIENENDNLDPNDSEGEIEDEEEAFNLRGPHPVRQNFDSDRVMDGRDLLDQNHNQLLVDEAEYDDSEVLTDIQERFTVIGWGENGNTDLAFQGWAKIEINLQNVDIAFIEGRGDFKPCFNAENWERNNMMIQGRRCYPLSYESY